MSWRQVVAFASVMACVEGVAGAAFSVLKTQNEPGILKGLVFGALGLAAFALASRLFLKKIASEIDLIRPAVFAASFVPLYWVATEQIYVVWPGRKSVPVFLLLAFGFALVIGEILRHFYNRGAETAVGHRDSDKRQILYVGFGVVVIAAVFEMSFAFLQVEVFRRFKIGVGLEGLTWAVAGFCATLVAASVPWVWERLRGPQRWLLISEEKRR